MKKNLLFIIDNLKGGGAERILITILQHLDAKKYNVDLFLINREGVEFYYILKIKVGHEKKSFIHYR